MIKKRIGANAWKRAVVLLLAVHCSLLAVYSQPFSGPHKYDGTHKNEITSVVS